MKKEEILKRFEGGAFVSLTLKEKRAITREIVSRYKKGEKEKGKILDEFVELTGYTRCYISISYEHTRRKQFYI